MPSCLRRRQRQPEEPLPPLSQLFLRSAKDLSPPRADAAERQPLRRQALVGVVDPQAEPVLRARGEHPIGFADAARDEVVDEHADIGFGAVEGDAVGAGGEARRIQPGDKPLRRRFLVAGRAVDLAGEEEARKALRLERRRELARIDVVVLDRIARPRHGGLLEARDAAAASRAARPPAARSRCRSGTRSGRRALPARGRSDGRRGRRSGRPCPRSRGNSAARGPGCRRSTSARGARFARMRSCTGPVVRVMPHSICGAVMRPVRAENGTGSSSPGCFCDAGPIDGAAVEAGRRPGLEPPEPEAEALERAGKTDRRPLAHAAGGNLALADVDQAAQERAGGQHDGRRREPPAVGEDEAAGAAVLDRRDRRPRPR